MSRAIKVSTIEQAESHLNNQSRQIQNLQYQIAQAAAQAREEARREAQKRVAALQSEMYEHIEGLQSEMAEMDQKHHEALKQQGIHFQKDLGGLKDWTKEELGKLKVHVDASVAEQRQRIDQIYAREADIAKRAKAMVKDLGLLFKAVSGRVNHRKFETVRWDRLSRDLGVLGRSPDPAEAQIAEARRLTSELWNLEEDIREAELRFNALHTFAVSEAKSILALMERNRNETFFQDADGNTRKDDDGKAVSVQVDYWTDGEYKTLEQQVKKTEARLVSLREDPALTFEEVLQITSDLKAMEAKQGALVLLAAQLGIASQQRRDISEDIVDALEHQGFTLQTIEGDAPAYSYLGRNGKPEMTEGVYAVLKHGTGIEVTIIVHPDKTGTKNQILFHRNDGANLNPDELERSMAEVRKVIQGLGYAMDTPRAPGDADGDVQIGELADANALSTVGISPATKARLGLSNSKEG